MQKACRLPPHASLAISFAPSLTHSLTCRHFAHFTKRYNPLTRSLYKLLTRYASLPSFSLSAPEAGSQGERRECVRVCVKQREQLAVPFATVTGTLRLETLDAHHVTLSLG